jgi:predicted lactoylglutathione lyase
MRSSAFAGVFQQKGMSMIDHVSFGSHDLDKAASFYAGCLNALGYTLQHRDATQVVFGKGEEWNFIVYPAAGAALLNGERTHLAFSAASEAAVQECYRVALAQGAESLRLPGDRPDINERYYGAMFKDLDQHTLELVYWRPAA